MANEIVTCFPFVETPPWWGLDLASILDVYSRISNSNVFAKERKWQELTMLPLQAEYVLSYPAFEISMFHELRLNFVSSAQSVGDFEPGRIQQPQIIASSWFSASKYFKIQF